LISCGPFLGLVLYCTHTRSLIVYCILAVFAHILDSTKSLLVYLVHSLTYPFLSLPSITPSNPLLYLLLCIMS
jgi:hypothetical protein